MHITTTTESESIPFIRSFSAIALVAISISTAILCLAFWFFSNQEMEERFREQESVAIREIGAIKGIPSQGELEILGKAMGMHSIDVFPRESHTVSWRAQAGIPTDTLAVQTQYGEVSIAFDRSGERERLFSKIFKVAALAVLMEVLLGFGFWWLSFKSEKEISRREREGKEMENELFFLAHYDPVTSLPNRTLFWERLDASIERARRLEKEVALAVFDICRFRSINDSYGRAIGDMALVETSRRIQKSCRKEDLVCRIGPNAFAVLLEDIPYGQTQYAVARLKKSVRENFSMAWNPPDSDISITLAMFSGISVFPEDGDSSELLLKKAENNMIEAT